MILILALPTMMVLMATAIAIPMTIVEKAVETVEKCIAKRKFRKNIMKAKYMDGEEKAIYIAETLNKYREKVME